MSVVLHPTPVLRTERLILRAPGPQDFRPWCDFLMSDRAAFVRPDDLDAGKLWRIFAHILGHWVLRGWGQFVVTDRAGAILGGVGPWQPIDWPEPELGWTLWNEAAEGKGYAFEAVIAARAHAFGALGWTTAVSYIDPANSRSLALAQRLGCVVDGGAAAPFPGLQVWRHPRGAAA